MRPQVGILASLNGLADQPGHDIAGRLQILGAPPRDKRLEIGQKLADGAFARIELLLRNLRLQSAENGQRPVAKRFSLGARNGQEIADHLDRDVLRKMRYRIDRLVSLLARRKVVDQPVNKLPHHDIHAGDGARRKGAGNGPSYAGMQWRVIEDK